MRLRVKRCHLNRFIRNRPWMTLMLVTLPFLALAHTAQQKRTLIVVGKSGEVAIIELNGRSYIEL